MNSLPRRQFLVRALLGSAAATLLASPPLAAHADPIHEAASSGNLGEVGRLLAQDPSTLERPDKDGKTPLLRALEAKHPEVVSLLAAKGASLSAADSAGISPLLFAVAALSGVGGDDNPAVSALCAALPPIALRLANTPLRDAWAQLFMQMHMKATIAADAFNAPITLTIDTTFDAALRTLVRTTRRTTGQTPVVTISAGTVQVGVSGTPVAAAPEDETWPVFTPDPRFKFGKTISRPVLESYLSRAVTHFGLLASSPEPSTACFDDDLRMLTAVGAKFIGRSAYVWAPADDDDAHFQQAAERAQRVHQADPEIVLEAAIFETAYRTVERISIPSWVFEEFGQPVERRNFRYEAMLYPDGTFRDHWMHDASVPDMTRRETQMWFYYRARRYIDAGCEALHLGQVDLMAQADGDYTHWKSLLRRVRDYATRYGRRRMVLCASHVRMKVHSGPLMFDFHCWPLRLVEAPSGAGSQKAELRVGYGDSIYRRSLGGVTPSGWSCDSLPFVVEFDNWGTSGRQGTGGLGLPWVWGYDEISWFAHQSPTERDRFLWYAHHWIRDNDPAGHIQIPTRRVLADGVPGTNMYQANRPSAACPTGFNQEETIRAIFAA